MLSENTRDDVMGELFDISLTNWGIAGMRRKRKVLEISFAQTNKDMTNLDADVVNWISLLFKPDWKSTMEIASPLDMYYEIGRERGWFSPDEDDRLFDRILFGSSLN